MCAHCPTARAIRAGCGCSRTCMTWRLTCVRRCARGRRTQPAWRTQPPCAQARTLHHRSIRTPSCPRQLRTAAAACISARRTCKKCRTCQTASPPRCGPNPIPTYPKSIPNPSQVRETEPTRLRDVADDLDDWSAARPDALRGVQTERERASAALERPVYRCLFFATGADA
jgi:hypothetical protein